MIKKVILTILISFLFLQSAYPGEVDMKKDIPYTKVTPDTSPYQKLDVYYNPAGKDLPVMLYIYGGGWGRAMKDECENVGRTFASRGIVTVIPNYRLVPAHIYPENVMDTATVVSWIRKNIKTYGGNPDMIFLCGHSSGGQMAAVLGFNPYLLKSAGLSMEPIAGLVTVSGLYDLREQLIFDENFVDQRIMKDQISGYVDGDPNVRHNASPITYVMRDNLPPVLVLYGENDKPYYMDQANRFFKALSKYGKSVRMEIIPGKDHDSIIDDIGTGSDKTTDVISEFIKFRSYD